MFLGAQAPLKLAHVKNKKKRKQAGAELGQAQIKLGLGFTSTLDS